MAGNNSPQSEAEITLGLLKAVHQDQALTQRGAASELGVALGLVNTYLKRCVKKGFIKVRQVPANRYSYYLTPKGFAEKSRLAGEFLSQSLSLFRQAQRDYGALLSQCVERGYSRIALAGVSDLAEILILYARDFPVSIAAIVDDTYEQKTFLDIPVVSSLEAFEDIDVIVITDLQNPQPRFDTLAKLWPAEKILTPDLLEIERGGRTTAGRRA
ncbi:MAG: winged helix-turn-helix transcriptional regulator [Rhodospirillales bacterium]|nr:winged helix-turn-helix transcriptional regulator [Rhodospirillales bacterium]